VHNTKITTNSPMIANSPFRSTARFSQSIQTSIYSADNTLHILLLIFII